METAKVDIRKLQLLNDRINQCIDALSQVRQSVHGLSHSSGQGVNPFQGVPGFGQGVSPFQGLSPFQGVPQGMAGYGVPQFAPGLSHTSPFQGLGYQGVPNFPIGITPQVPWQLGFGGLSHTSPESDPYIAIRIGQTFPYAQLPYPPVISLF